MFCANCKKEMSNSKTNMDVPGKESTVKAVNVPCSVCPGCNAQVVDGVIMAVAKKGAKKCKEATMDFEKMGGIGVSAGKIAL